MKDQLPVAGVDLILGNELAGGKMFPATPEAAENPAADVFGHAPSGTGASAVYPACVVGHAQTCHLGNEVDISHTFFKEPKTPVKLWPGNKNESVAFTGIPNNLCLAVDKEQFSRAQQSDSTCLPVCCKAASTWNPTRVVLMMAYCLLGLGHDHLLSGYLGIRRSYDRVSCYYFWPGLKTEVVRFCPSFYPHQMVGKWVKHFLSGRILDGGVL